MKAANCDRQKVVIRLLKKVMGAQSYIPNSIFMDEETGYSADYRAKYEAGKSTICANWRHCDSCLQIGSYVPTQMASYQSLMRFIPESELLMTWYRGQSTFIVEMMEANHAIHRQHPVLDFV